MEITELDSCPTCHRPYGFTDDGKVGRKHPRTSYKAATMRFGSQRFRVLEALAASGEEGMTAMEVSSVVQLSPNQTATRLLELRESGWAEYLTDELTDVVVYRPTRHSEGLVQVATPAGRSLLSDLLAKVGVQSSQSINPGP